MVGLALIALCGVVGWEVYTNGEQSKITQAALVSASKAGMQDARYLSITAGAAMDTLNESAGKLEIAVMDLDQTIQTVNRPCGVRGLPCGVLADADKTMETVRGTFGQIEIAADHEDRNLTKLDGQEDQLFSDTHASLTQLTAMLSSGTETLDSGRDAIDNLNGMLKDQTLRNTMVNVQSMTQSGAGIMDTGDQLFKKLTYNTLHPSKNKFVRTWRATEPYVPLGVKALTCYLVPNSCL